jgi:Tol biopolymer transport system component
LAVACVAAWAILPGLSAQETPKPAVAKPGPKAQKQNQAAGPGILLLARRDGLIVLSPDGAQKEELKGPERMRSGFQAWLSPDGRRAAYIVTAGRVRPPRREGEEPEPWPFKVIVRKLGADEAPAIVDMPAFQLNLTWAPDSKRILLTVESMPGKFENQLLDPETGKRERFDLPDGARVLDWSRDGKTLLVLHRKDKKVHLGLASKGGEEIRSLIELKGGSHHMGKLSPDATRVLYTDADPTDKNFVKWGLSSKPYVLNLRDKDKKSVLLADFPQNGQAVGIAWSPSGKRIAYTWKQLHADVFKKDTININDTSIPTEAFLMIADPDGRNARTVFSAKADNAINMILGLVDWR